MSTSTPYALAVLISTHNRRERLGACLDALARRRRTPSTFEVIVADDGSADGTAEMVEGYESLFRLRALRLEKRGKPAALNAALEVCEATICLFIDDDVIASPGLVAEPTSPRPRRSAASRHRQADPAPAVPARLVRARIRRRLEPALRGTRRKGRRTGPTATGPTSRRRGTSCARPGASRRAPSMRSRTSSSATGSAGPAASRPISPPPRRSTTTRSRDGRSSPTSPATAPFAPTSASATRIPGHGCSAGFAPPTPRELWLRRLLMSLRLPAGLLAAARAR